MFGVFGVDALSCAHLCVYMRSAVTYACTIPVRAAMLCVNNTCMNIIHNHATIVAARTYAFPFMCRRLDDVDDRTSHSIQTGQPLAKSAQLRQR